MVLFLPPPFPPPPPQATLRDPQGAKKIETRLDSSPLLSSCIQMTDSRLPHRPSLAWGSIPREVGRHICSMFWGSWLGSLPASSHIQSEASIFSVGFYPSPGWLGGVAQSKPTWKGGYLCPVRIAWEQL